MNQFVDAMWNYAFRGKVGNTPISDADRAILVDANKIRDDLERYNSRAFFDNRNLEDILSLLSFEALGNESQTPRYQTVVKAIARTIELSCAFKHRQEGFVVPPDHNSHYHAFWNVLLSGKFKDNLPALITFNYDLVFERTLWEFFHHLNDAPRRPNVQSCGLKYSFGLNDCSMRKTHKQYDIPVNDRLSNVKPGQKAEFIITTDGENFSNQKTEADIPYFKLHGSLNWSQEFPRTRPSRLPIEALEKPLILPPVFNKMSATEINCVWKSALDVLRSAVNIIIVGYSLPETDIYMQYFLKAAVGPNSNLQNIIVFDPELYRDGEKCEAMISRYRECFSPQFSSRIIFQPTSEPSIGEPDRGTFANFVWCLEKIPEALCFFP